MELYQIITPEYSVMRFGGDDFSNGSGFSISIMDLYDLRNQP